MSDNTQIRLTRTVKRILDVLRVVAIVCLIVWPLAVVVMAIGQSSDRASWGVDILVYSGFTIDLSEFATDIAESSGVRDPIIKGTATLGIDTSSRKALIVAALFTELGGIVGLYVLLQLRAIFASLLGGVSFAPENSERIKKIGFVVIIWTLVNPIVKFFAGQVILREYSLNVPGVQLHPAIEISGVSLFIGVGLIVLSGVLNEAAKIQEDQQLTV